jgi:hypothetical protein
VKRSPSCPCRYDGDANAAATAAPTTHSSPWRVSSASGNAILMVSGTVNEGGAPHKECGEGEG